MQKFATAFWSLHSVFRHGNPDVLQIYRYIREIDREGYIEWEGEGEQQILDNKNTSKKWIMQFCVSPYFSIIAAFGTWINSNASAVISSVMWQDCGIWELASRNAPIALSLHHCLWSNNMRRLKMCDARPHDKKWSNNNGCFNSQKRCTPIFVLFISHQQCCAAAVLHRLHYRITQIYTHTHVRAGWKMWNDAILRQHIRDVTIVYGKWRARRRVSKSNFAIGCFAMCTKSAQFIII